MDFFILLKGLALGFVLAMSIGPIALLCISNTIEKGRLFGISVALGAGTADGIYGLAAGFGISILMTYLSDYSILLKLLGGCFLIYLGIKIMRSTPNKKRVEINAMALLKTYLTIVALTLINPLTIATYMGAFAGMGVGNTNGDLFLSLLLGFGIFAGSSVWHSLLVAASSVLKDKIKEKHLLTLNKFSGLLLCIFGTISLVSLGF
jgi:threonine/homoserine/homoserine lactone efflux protein